MDAINVKNLLRVRRRRRSAFVRRKLKMLLKEYKKQQVKIATKIGIVYEKNNKEIVDRLTNNLGNDYKISITNKKTVYGATMVAFRHSKLELDDNFEDNFIKSYKEVK